MGNVVETVFRTKDEGLLAMIEKANKNLNSLGTNATQTGVKIDAGLSVFKGNLLADFFQRGANQALDFARKSVTAFNDANNAALGLQSIARFKGISGTDASDSVKNLDIVKDGLISIGDASTAVKSLLAAGFGLPQSIEIVKRFGDSAAFGRQSALSFGEAIRSAAEGVKNGNSILVDNAGVTKNLSVILKERGFEMQDLNDKVKSASALEALYQGLMKETQGQVGDAAKLTGTFAGQQAQLEASYQKLLVATGSQITKNKELGDGLKSLQELISGYADEVEKTGGATSNLIGSNVSAIGNLIKSGSELAKTPIGKAFADALPSLGQFYKLTKDTQVPND
jgi:hypothetical protein